MSSSNQPDPEPEFAVFERLCAKMLSADKTARRDALRAFDDALACSGPDLSDEQRHDVFRVCHLHVLATLRDSSEAVREEAIAVVRTLYLETLAHNDYYLSYLMPVAVERLGTPECVEEAEELRLQLLCMLHGVLAKYNARFVKPFAGEYAAVLQHTLLDGFPSVVTQSLHTVIELAQCAPEAFAPHAHSLLPAALRAMAHQRYRVRIDGVRCVGELVLHADCKALEESIAPLTEALFDAISDVRLAAAEVGTNLMLKYRDRYSYFHKLLPLVLTCLYDEWPENRNAVGRLWESVGINYEQENERDLKDQMDFPTERPAWYLADAERPRLGCRMLVQREVGKLVAALGRELVAWQTHVRYRCAQLLCAVVVHCEDAIVQHMQGLLAPIYSAARDEENRVNTYVLRACYMMGRFVPPENWTKLVLPVFAENTHFGHMAVVVEFIRGTPVPAIEPHLLEIVRTLHDSGVAYDRNKIYQKEMLECISAIQTSYTPVQPVAVGQMLFNMVVTLYSVAHPENFAIRYERVHHLRAMLCIPTNSEMWKRYLPGLLACIKTDARTWTEQSADSCIFETIMAHAGAAFGQNLDAIGRILSEALSTDADPDSRLKTLLALGNTLEKKEALFESAKDVDRFFLHLIESSLADILVWRAGRTAEALRTAAANCLASVLKKSTNVFLDKPVVVKLGELLLPLLYTLTEDASRRSRYLAIDILMRLKSLMMRHALWKCEHLIAIYPLLLKRLDDPFDDVRMCAIRALRVLLQFTPAPFTTKTNEPHHEVIIDTLFTHFDDADEDFGKLVLRVLAVMCNVNTEIMRVKTKENKGMLRSPAAHDRLNELISAASLG